MSGESGRAWFAPSGPDGEPVEWINLGTVTECDFQYAPAELAKFQVRDADQTVRAFARVGPDGVLTSDAPLVEVDPEALLLAFEEHARLAETTHHPA